MSKDTSLQLTPREVALITICRRLRNGTIEKLGIQDGQPAVIVTLAQRVDLTKDSEVDAVLSEGFR